MPAVTAIPNNATQVERAIRAWLIECAAGTADDIYISNDSRERQFPITDIIAQESKHHPENTGTEIWQVTIQHKFPAANQPGQTNLGKNRVQMDDRVGKQMAAMLQSNDNLTLNATWEGITTSGRLLATTGSAQEQANNADMADFTCLFVRYMGATRGKPDDDSCAWVEVRNYEVTAANFAIN